MNLQSIHRLILIGLVIISFSLSGCFTYRATAPEQPGATDPRSQVVWSFAWGLVNQTPKIDNCNSQPLSEVTVKSNLAFDILTVITLGIVSPKVMEWRCAPAEPDLGQLPATSNSKTQLSTVSHSGNTGTEKK